MSEGSGRLTFARQRQNRLLDILRTQGSIVVSEVAPQLQVSELTIRRDVNALAERGLVSRVHGGATLVEQRTPFHAPTPPTNRTGQRFRYTFGVVVPSLDYYWPSVIGGMRTAAAEAQVRLALRSSSYNILDDRRHLEVLAGSPGIDGLIVAPDTGDTRSIETLQWLDDLPMPVMMVERKPPPPMQVNRLEWAASDHAAGAAMAVRHLHSLGHRKMALVVHSPSRSNPQLRSGWRDELDRLGLDPATQLIESIDSFDGPGRDAEMSRVLTRCRGEGVTAAIVNPDPAAIAFQQHCVDTGVSVPDDLAVLAYDDELASLGQPPITAVLPPKFHAGRLAVELLVARLLEGDRRPPHRVEIAPLLNIRESTVPLQTGET